MNTAEEWNMDTADRLKREVEHGKKILEELSTSRGGIWSWSSPAGRERLNERVETIARIARFAPGKKVLEIGCGLGVYSRPFASYGIELTATDLSPDLLEEAQRLSLAEGKVINYKVEDAMKAPYPDGTFDAVVGVSILHHLDPETGLRESMRLVKPGGWVAFSEPNYLNPQIAFERATPWTREWTLTSPDETAFIRFPLKKLMEKVGYEEIEIAPFDFLHPAIPARFVPFAKKMSAILSNTPIVKEIAGSLRICGRKPLSPSAAMLRAL